MDLINDILDISKIEAGQMVIELKPMNLGDLISDLVEIFDLLIKRHDEEQDKTLSLKVNIRRSYIKHRLLPIN